MAESKSTRQRHFAARDLICLVRLYKAIMMQYDNVHEVCTESAEVSLLASAVLWEEFNSEDFI